jgi:segregation and condensation protein A
VTLLDEGPVVTEAPARFTVRLDNFTGPFDLLLQLIGKHQLDVTELALHRVTDDFIAHLTALGDDMDLDETSEFLVIAATLLDLKAARLLPDAEANTEDGDDGLLEARDLLFARLLQYRAYKQVAGLFVELEATALRRFPRSVALEERFAGLLPEVLLGVDPARFADLAAAVLRPKPPPTVGVDHLHAPAVSVAEHVAILRERLAELGEATFAALTVDCTSALEVIARFMAVLELFREATIVLDQPECFGELTVRWTPPGVVSAPDGPDLGEAPELTDPAALEAALEALLLVVDAPTEDDALAGALDQPVARVRATLTAMAQRYAADGRGIDLRRVGDGWRFYTRDTYAPFVERLLLGGQRAKLTRAALETLAVVAYRQPVTRARVAAVRGVNCDGVLRTLVTRGLVEEAGVDGATQGTLFRTTELFLERLGLTSVDDLPPLAPLLPDVDAIDAIDAGLDTGRGQ